MSQKAKVIFLDRDGVINEYPGDGEYVGSLSEFKFIPGSIEAIKKLRTNGFELFVISNQSGIAKGLYTQKDLDQINKKIIQVLKKHRTHLSGIYCCLHGPADNCSCRKPKTGLLEKAVSDFKIKPQLSFFIGDSFVDMKTALAFGAKTVLLLSGKEKISQRNNWEFEPDYLFDNFLLAAHYIISHYGQNFDCSR